MKSFVRLAGGLSAVATTALLSGCAAQQEPCCADHPIKPFKAVYQYKVGDGPAISQTWLSNGKGQVIMKSTTASANDPYTLVDYVSGESTALNPAMKTALATKLDLPWVSNGTCEQTDATILGDKTIDGHPCKGWKVTKGETTSEYWLGDDTGCYVQVTSTLPDQRVAELKLVEFQPTVETASFDVPKDYAPAGSTVRVEAASSGKSVAR